MVYSDSNACRKPIPASDGNSFDLLDTGRVKEDQMGHIQEEDTIRIFMGFPDHDFSGKNDL